MPNRIVREGILTSERVNALTPNAELFYRRLLSVVDDFGRYTANLTLLRASCYPLKLDSVKEDSISKHLAECVGARLIVLYTVADKAFLELQDFRQQVRAKDSKYPAPDVHSNITCEAGAKQMISDAHLDGDGDGDGGDIAPSPKSDSPPAEPAFIELPLNDGSQYPITAGQVREFSGLYPSVDVEQSLRSMRAWCVSNPTKRKTRHGVLRFVNSWLAKEQDHPKANGHSQYGGAPMQGVSPASMRRLA